jgi:hypothetical protein
LFFRREEIMLVHYKKNKKPTCYDSDAPITAGRIPPDERPTVRSRVPISLAWIYLLQLRG